ncbi:TetR/AcrR family transcriptional regulator [Streptomyces sp. NPDC085639]|uniref:TetR/AcrR family transcriptional regulator n=1 Tax=Streptomyces sp. NPDC085639 TaxID=3365734 RepID=UPI0037D27BC7
MADGRVERGKQTRRAVLERRMSIASVDGLEGLSLGKIAADIGLSKSGVFALFGSKEDLQLATVRAAVEVFLNEVVRPVQRDPGGLPKVWRLCARWLDYSGRRVFPGGCFFYSVSAEFDARPGPVRDEIAKVRSDWTRYVERLLDEARLAGRFRSPADADAVPQLAFVPGWRAHHHPVRAGPGTAPTFHRAARTCRPGPRPRGHRPVRTHGAVG